MLRLLYMGTNAFAVAPLKAINESKIFDSIFVVTQPDKPSGRKNKMKSPEVKVYAEEAGLDYFQPESLKAENFRNILDKIVPDMIIVASYGKLLPKYLLDTPKYGSINIHASLLPEYRGAAPVNRIIMDGKKYTGITIMYMAEGLDTGDIIMQNKIEIGDNENFGELYDRLSILGANTIISAIPAIIGSTNQRIKQDDSLSCYASKLTKDDEIIDWSLSSEVIKNRIRGLSPEPCAFTIHEKTGRTLKVYSTIITDNNETHNNYGEIISCGKTIEVACGIGTLCLKSLQFQGEKRLSDKDFLNGRKLSVGDKLK